jgi:lipopolysaccharide/colanic/teichoic acid biosynthesis glycosyltransferase
MGRPLMMSRRQHLVKRAFDLAGAGCGLLLFGWAIPALCWVARHSTGGPGLFRQQRVGRHGDPFEILKLRTMRANTSGTTVTTAVDPRITRIGRVMRRTKVDELPQLINVLRGEMSLVGPRPDVPGGVLVVGPQAEVILSVPPGITGPASLVFRDEESLLAEQTDPERYNWEVLMPTKARINEHYVRTWSLKRDLRYLVMTVCHRRLSEADALA